MKHSQCIQHRSNTRSDQVVHCTGFACPMHDCMAPTGNLGGPNSVSRRTWRYSSSTGSLLLPDGTWLAGSASFSASALDSGLPFKSGVSSHCASGATSSCATSSVSCVEWSSQRLFDERKDKIITTFRGFFLPQNQPQIPKRAAAVTHKILLNFMVLYNLHLY